MFSFCELLQYLSINGVPFGRLQFSRFTNISPDFIYFFYTLTIIDRERPRAIVIYKVFFFWLDEAQGHMNGAYIETWNHLETFASLACKPLYHYVCGRLAHKTRAIVAWEIESTKLLAPNAQGSSVVTFLVLSIAITTTILQQYQVIIYYAMHKSTCRV